MLRYDILETLSKITYDHTGTHPAPFDNHPAHDVESGFWQQSAVLDADTLQQGGGGAEAVWQGIKSIPGAALAKGKELMGRVYGDASGASPDTGQSILGPPVKTPVLGEVGLQSWEDQRDNTTYAFLGRAPEHVKQFATVEGEEAWKKSTGQDFQGPAPFGVRQAQTAAQASVPEGVAAHLARTGAVPELGTPKTDVNLSKQHIAFDKGTLTGEKWTDELYTQELALFDEVVTPAPPDLNTPRYDPFPSLRGSSPVETKSLETLLAEGLTESASRGEGRLGISQNLRDSIKGRIEQYLNLKRVTVATVDQRKTIAYEYMRARNASDAWIQENFPEVFAGVAETHKEIEETRETPKDTEVGVTASKSIADMAAHVEGIFSRGQDQIDDYWDTQALGDKPAAGAIDYNLAMTNPQYKQNLQDVANAWFNVPEGWQYDPPQFDQTGRLIRDSTLMKDADAAVALSPEDQRKLGEVLDKQFQAKDLLSRMEASDMALADDRLRYGEQALERGWKTDERLGEQAHEQALMTKKYGHEAAENLEQRNLEQALNNERLDSQRRIARMQTLSSQFIAELQTGTQLEISQAEIAFKKGFAEDERTWKSLQETGVVDPRTGELVPYYVDGTGNIVTGRSKQEFEREEAARARTQTGMEERRTLLQQQGWETAERKAAEARADVERDREEKYREEYLRKWENEDRNANAALQRELLQTQNALQERIQYDLARETALVDETVHEMVEVEEQYDKYVVGDDGEGRWTKEMRTVSKPKTDALGQPVALQEIDLAALENMVATVDFGRPEGQLAFGSVARYDEPSQGRVTVYNEKGEALTIDLPGGQMPRKDVVKTVSREHQGNMEMLDIGHSNNMAMAGFQHEKLMISQKARIETEGSQERLNIDARGKSQRLAITAQKQADIAVEKVLQTGRVELEGTFAEKWENQKILEGWKANEALWERDLKSALQEAQLSHMTDQLDEQGKQAVAQIKEQGTESRSTEAQKALAMQTLQEIIGKDEITAIIQRGTEERATQEARLEHAVSMQQAELEAASRLQEEQAGFQLTAQTQAETAALEQQRRAAQQGITAQTQAETAQAAMSREQQVRGLEAQREAQTAQLGAQTQAEAAQMSQLGTAGAQSIQQIQAQQAAQQQTMERQFQLQRQAIETSTPISQTRNIVHNFTTTLNSAISNATKSGDYSQVNEALGQELPPLPVGIRWNREQGGFSMRSGFEGREMDVGTRELIAALTPAFKARDRAEQAVQQANAIQLDLTAKRQDQAKADEQFRQHMLTGDIDSAEEAAARFKMAETASIAAKTKMEHLQMLFSLLQNPVQLGMAKRHGLLGQIESVLGFTMSNVPSGPVSGAGSIPASNEWQTMDSEEQTFSLAAFVEQGGSPDEFLRLVAASAPAQLQQVQYGVL